MAYASKEKAKEYQHEWYIKNRERVLAYQREYHLQNKEHRSEVGKLWRKNNRDRIRYVNGKWVTSHPENVKATQANYMVNHRQEKMEKARLHRQSEKAAVALAQKKWHQKNRHRVLEYAHNRRAIKLEASVGGVNIKKLFDEWNGLCGICHLVVEGQYHIDHIMPLSKGGKHMQSNLQVTHPRCNLIKGSKILDYKGDKII